MNQNWLKTVRQLKIGKGLESRRWHKKEIRVGKKGRGGGIDLGSKQKAWIEEEWLRGMRWKHNIDPRQRMRVNGVRGRKRALNSRKKESKK